MNIYDSDQGSIDLSQTRIILTILSWVVTFVISISLTYLWPRSCAATYIDKLGFKLRDALRCV
ncbi:hypothetical protein Hanom_Chr04g00354451 [Helianthus anomalus]